MSRSKQRHQIDGIFTTGVLHNIITWASKTYYSYNLYNHSNEDLVPTMTHWLHKDLKHVSSTETFVANYPVTSKNQ